MPSPSGSETSLPQGLEVLRTGYWLLCTPELVSFYKNTCSRCRWVLKVFYQCISPTYGKQSLPKPSKSASSQSTPVDGPAIDLHSELARGIQPLLEQEALLESFIEEAKAHRKFEDAKTLKGNLHEIRAEIDKLVVGAQEGGLIPSQESAKSKNLTN